VCVITKHMASGWNNNKARNLMPTAKIMKVFALLSTKICQSKFHFIFFSCFFAFPFCFLLVSFHSMRMCGCVLCAVCVCECVGV